MSNRTICRDFERDPEAHGDEACIYNVYEIWEGAVFSEYSFCDYRDASDRFDKLVTQAKQCMASQPQLYYDSDGSTVHLYDTVANELKREILVEPEVRL